MTRVLHTARISNVEIIKFVVNNKDGKIYHLYYLLQNIKVYATRPKGSLGIHWNFAYWRPKGNLQVCFFVRGKFVFPLRGLYL